MSRLRRIAEWDRLFFITTNLAPNAPFLQPPEMDLLLDVLNTVRRATGFLLLGYVAMPDHAHLLFAARTASMSHIMHQWKFKAGYAIQQRRHRSGAFWQPRYFDFICRRSRDVTNKLLYIHQNPVTRNLVANPEDWRWSSAAFYLKKGVSRLEPDFLDFSGDPDELLWTAPNRHY